MSYICSDDSSTEHEIVFESILLSEAAPAIHQPDVQMIKSVLRTLRPDQDAGSHEEKVQLQLVPVLCTCIWDYTHVIGLSL